MTAIRAGDSPAVPRPEAVVNSMKPLAELADIRTGYVRGRVDPVPDGRYGVVQSGDVDGVEGIPFGSLKRTDDLDPSYRHLLHEGDIVFVPRGENHHAALVDETVQDLVATSQLYIIRTHKGVAPAFLTWYLNHERAQSFFDTFARGSTVRSINQKILGELSVPLPPLDRQHAIARVARLVRRELELTRELLQKRETLIQTRLLDAAR